MTRALLERVAVGWLAPDAVALRQAPATVSILVSLVVVESTVTPERPGLLAAAAVLVGLAQLAGVFVPWKYLRPVWRATLPLTQMAAIGLLDIGTGLQMAEFDILLILPMGMLALRPERWGPALALAMCTVVLLAPAVVDVDRRQPLLHAVVTLLVVVPTVVGAYGIVQASRVQARELQRARDALDVRAEQLRASRDTLSSIIEAATEQAIVATDLDGVVVSANSGAERILGRAADELVGHEVGDLVADPGPAAPQDHAGVPLGRLVGSAADGGTHVEEWRVVLADGTTRYLELVATLRPALDGTGPALPAGYLFVGTDVTPRREEQRQQDEFIGLVSHELRTPLASILGYLELIRSGEHVLDDEQSRYLDVVERNANRLRSLVDELLASAQVVVGAPLAAQEVDVGEVVRAAVTSQAPVSRAAGVRVDVDADGPVPLLSDPQRLTQIVDNLVSNAVKHSLAGDRVVVEVHAGASPEGARTARIRVVDQGAGIAPDELSRLTERFYRTRETKRRRVRGVGLGLSLVQAIVAEHGGTLTIDSELGSGTQVEVVLPDLEEQATGEP
ncbi:PAS domain-containing protein [Cellulomonas sp. Sa3CUA2]|uniref:Sensor-like histidine kinase SenX3 n=1 Tax=Cellulomonas avistercoris TaxID=2762242 RepID=A0ABR8QEZ2_9CELL|nr:ATP-binding protein [Cellulomonas avistercoris]MBD7918931.1 PAS domain-containing protein [Cellulomonas avistercoris]